MQKGDIWNPNTYTFENYKYLGSIIGDLVINSDEIPQLRVLSCTTKWKTIPTKTTSLKIVPIILTKKR